MHVRYHTRRSNAACCFYWRVVFIGVLHTSSLGGSISILTSTSNPKNLFAHATYINVASTLYEQCRFLRISIRVILNESDHSVWECMCWLCCNVCWLIISFKWTHCTFKFILIWYYYAYFRNCLCFNWAADFTPLLRLMLTELMSSNDIGLCYAIYYQPEPSLAK